MDLNIYSVKNVVNRLLEYVSIVLATSFFVIICEMNTFRSFGLQFELLMSYVLCFMFADKVCKRFWSPKSQHSSRSEEIGGDRCVL